MDFTDPLWSYQMRGLFFTFYLGGAIIFLAGSAAYWYETDPWVFRCAGLALLALGVDGTWSFLGPMSGVRAMIASVIVAAALIAQDFWVERAEKALKEEQAKAWRDL